jgi:hypothetical protein
MTTARESLLNDARAAGYTVTIGKDGHTEIAKRVGRWKRLRGLVIYPDGCAVVAEVDLAATACIRDYKTMRVVLGI